jgi:hypothetical protein
LSSYSTILSSTILIALLLLTTAGCAVQNWVDERLATPNPVAELTLTPTFGPTITRQPTITPTFTPTVTPTPTITPTPTATRVPDIISYTDPQNRFTLQMPDTWLVQDGDPQALIFASDETRLATNMLEEGAVFIAFPGELQTTEPISPTAVLNEFIANFVVFDSEEIIQPPMIRRIGGQDTAVATADGVFNRYPVRIEYYTFTQENRFLVIVAMLASETLPAHQNNFNQIMRSIRLQ